MIQNLSMINNQIMKKFLYTVKITIISILLTSSVVAKQSDYLKEGISLFNKQKYEKSKILFEKDIVFDPKSEKSYLYLAKIFYESDNDLEQEINLENVLLINPQNDEAIYMLTLLKIKQSDYVKAKELIDKFVLVCKSFCTKEDEMREKFKKLIPENAKGNN